jgi:two-component system, chemotaxis family, chemotaxis protein CheY
MSRTILVVEDESDLRLSVSLALTMAGMQVVEAADGTRALDLLDHPPADPALPDAVLLDLRLPDVDGWAVLERLRQRGLVPGLPVIVGSADADPAARQRARDAGCAGYLVKPFEPEALLTLLQRVAPPADR